MLSKNKKVFSLRSLLGVIILAICIAAFFNLRASSASFNTPVSNNASAENPPNTTAGENILAANSSNTTDKASNTRKSTSGTAPVTVTSGAKEQKPAAKGSTLKAVIAEKNIDASTARFSIFIDKTAHTLTLLANGISVKSYHVELGDNGLGDKAISGDHKTPEGTFYICEKSVLSPADQYLGTRWMRLSYPNIEDAERGLAQGLISRQTYNSIINANQTKSIPLQETALGGGVGIHGGSTAALGKDWTYGCTGLSNKDVEEIYPYVKIGTKVVIQK